MDETGLIKKGSRSVRGGAPAILRNGGPDGDNAT